MPSFPAIRLRRSDLLVAAGSWALATCIILPSYVSTYGWARAGAGMLYTVALDTAAVFAVIFGLVPRYLGRGTKATTLLLTLVAAALSAVLYNGGYGLVLGYPVRWGVWPLIYAIMAHAKSYGVLGLVLLTKTYFEGQQRLLLAQKAQAVSELKSLRAQVDPHFLFNNLNILYALIQQNQEEASHFLSCFSSLYRYLIRHKDADLVPLEEELRFADEYIYLLSHRFGKAYHFEQVITPSPSQMPGLFVVPGTLQVLLENVVKHNRGDEDEPLEVLLEAGPDTLRVRHRLAPKRTPVESLGTGLANLRERYKLLAGHEVRVQKDDFFEVTVPVLRPQERRGHIQRGAPAGVPGAVAAPAGAP